jgi:hypothetical protein
VQRRVALLAVIALSAFSVAAAGQSLSQRGFAEGCLFLFPEPASNDPVRVIGDALVREDVFVKAAPWIQFAGGVDLRASSHDEVDERWTIDASDRGVRRPRLSVRRASATMARAWLTVDVGKQFIRWGKTDIVTPTDRFAPRDFVRVVDIDFIAVTGARAVVQLGGDTLDLVWVPRFTPSRIPLPNQRWTVIPPQAEGVPIVNQSAAMPSGSQTGARWSHVGEYLEYSASFFNGFNHLPNINANARWTAEPLSVEIDVTRVYPALRAYGADAAVPTRWFTVKGEASYFTSKTASADEYVLYVIQLERQSGEWLFVGGYAGEIVTERRAAMTFAPDRGLARSFVGRASYTIDPNRTVAVEGVVRQNGQGVWATAEYSEARGAHWRVTAKGSLIRGDADDFLGQYRLNSHVTLALRYSF